MHTKTPLTQERLKHRLNYNPETGVFIWINTSDRGSTRVGTVAGATEPRGYIKIQVDGVSYGAHRLAWLYMTGRFPDNFIDHINQSKGDNRFCNLREATHSENLRNTGKKPYNKSGYKGVTWDKQLDRWKASCRINKKIYHIGNFLNIEDAARAYEDFAEEYHGEFYCKNTDVKSILQGDKQSIGSRLSFLRFRNKESLQQIAEALGYSRVYVNKIERDIQDNPPIKYLIKAAQHFGVTVGFLIGEAAGVTV